MSMWANYLKEKTEDLMRETEHGFATYKYIDEKTVYIMDLYVDPDFRKSNVASKLADSIIEEAKGKGCVKLLGSVVPSNKNSTASLKVLLAYGMVLKSSSNDFIVFEKEIV